MTATTARTAPDGAVSTAAAVPRTGAVVAGDDHIDVKLVDTPDGWTVTLASPGAGLDLSDLVPAIEAFGFHVVDATTSTLGEGAHQRLAVTTPHGPDPDGIDRLVAALHATLTGRTTIDELLELVTSSTLTWQEVEILRAYRRLFELLGNGWPATQVTRALVGNPDAASALISVFNALLAPDADAIDQPRADHLLDTLRMGISSLAEDRIIADLGQAIHATLRTNAFSPDRTVTLPDGRQVEVLACKFRSAALPGVPSPVPDTEILVTSPLTSGVHLRGGPIARGGLRASDRTEDVRSEVLGLVTAQIVKNSMIVPTGAKGGFVLHHPPSGRTAMVDAIEDAYRVYVTGLLSITDNVRGDEVVPPPAVRRRDGDDPYLVVAADKGTARLSDTANELAREAGFWLGDAFASGGSSGYDHKALGITARGAWVAIARHFRELGIDIHTDEISVVGIGDMSGDVFGNGMLTSSTLRLVAAFDHRDVFLDPDPDPAASFAERRRLFELPGSSWQDFDRDVISTGGGVFSRHAKRIELTRPVQELLRVDDRAMTPNALIRAILRANVDLLYAGGIGTYVAASDETGVSDRTNAPVRVLADEVRARVIGEGANLAITQRGRIEYARRGGRVDQDAIHNAAGVAISDREVNLKILMAPLVTDGSMDLATRDELMLAATDDVVAAVLHDVDAQVWLLSREHGRSATTLNAYRRHLDRLEAEGLVDRAVDILPEDANLRARAEAGGGLTRPELATIVAATKRSLAGQVVDTPLVTASCARPALHAYFPAGIRARLADEIDQHRLADEITALRIVSNLVDRLGPTTIHELARDHDAHPSLVVAAMWIAEHLLDAHEWWRHLQDLAGEVLPDTLDEVARMLCRTQLELGTVLLQDAVVSMDDLDVVVARLEPIAASLGEVTTALATTGPQARLRMRLLDDLVPDELAVAAATGHDRAHLMDVAHLLTIGQDMDPVAGEVTTSSALDALRVADERLRLHDIRAAMARHMGGGEWTRRHRRMLERDLVLVHRRAAGMVLSRGRAALGARIPEIVTLRARTSAALAECRNPDDAPNAIGVAVGITRQTVDDLAQS